jgi:hypothetical protein
MTPMEIQTLVAAIGGFGLLATAIATYLNTRAVRVKVNTIDKNTNGAQTVMAAKIDQLHATLMPKVAAPAAPPPPSALPGPPAAQ